MNAITASVENTIEQIRESSGRGDFLTAHDCAIAGLQQFPNDQSLRYQAVLTLARSGAPERAALLYSEYQLGATDDEDCLSLAGRLAKDRAWLEQGAAKTAAFREAAECYHDVYRKTGGYFPAINAATLYRFADERKLSEQLATEVLELVIDCSNDEYYPQATAAEACLLLGDIQGCSASLRNAATCINGNWAMAGSTRSQLLQVCGELNIDPIVTDALKPPCVIHFCGHMPSGTSDGKFPISEVQRVRMAVNTWFDCERPAFGFGSAAAGADLLVAEALMERGGELTLVLPFDREEFKQVSVAPYGELWLTLFDQACKYADASGGLLQITNAGYQGDNELFVYASEYAMGLALLRSRQLGAAVSQLAMWGGVGEVGTAGTAGDIARWKNQKLTSHCIDTRADRSEPLPIEKLSSEILRGVENGHSGTDKPGTATAHERRLRAMLFADVKGFTRFPEANLPEFYTSIFSPLADVLNACGKRLLYRNTWGDAIFAVFPDAATAATVACEMQQVVQRQLSKNPRLPSGVALRIGLHYGPVYYGYDAAKGGPTFYGTEVSKTARIEPITPVGENYATEAFATALTLASADRFQCDYVGQVPSAKAYGVFRMYHVRQSPFTLRNKP